MRCVALISMLKAMSSLSYYSSPHLMVSGNNMLKAHALYPRSAYCRIHRSYASRMPTGWVGRGTGASSRPVPQLTWRVGITQVQLKRAGASIHGGRPEAGVTLIYIYIYIYGLETAADSLFQVIGRFACVLRHFVQRPQNEPF